MTHQPLQHQPLLQECWKMQRTLRLLIISHVGDSDGDDQTLTFTITGGTLTIDNSGSVGGGITYGGSGNGSSGFTAQGTLSNLNAALDDAVFNPTANLNGTDVATISFTANDGQATSTAAAVTFSIGAVNDVPSFALPGSPNQSGE